MFLNYARGVFMIRQSDGVNAHEIIKKIIKKIVFLFSNERTN